MNSRIFLVFLCLMLVLGAGCAKRQNGAPNESGVISKEGSVYIGEVKGRSRKAQGISLEVGSGGDLQTVLLRFDDKTLGVDHLRIGNSVVINVEKRGKETFATFIKPDYAKLPVGVTAISTPELWALVQDPQKMVLIDSRTAGYYHQASLPGAIFVPLSMLKEKNEKALPVDKNALLIFYCSGPTCGVSTISANLAKQMGYLNVRVYLEGVPAWVKAGFPVYASREFLLSEEPILIDLRSEERSVAGHIPGAVSIPYDDLVDYLDDLPEKAPLVFYGDEHGKMLNALDEFREMGYKKVSVVAGGFQGWVASGGAVEKGSLKKAIHWQRVPGKHEVLKKDFLKAVSEQADNTIILDVRTSVETTSGMIEGAYSIPLEDLSAKMHLLPKNKRIYTHCSTGIRAEMAATELRRCGFQS
ncbi:MAG: rhodanese-like domain-containing protein, partial [Desulfuromusa sp.]|nr:rhodanese-like domain-containing protein [Desulfuromusa sp.]